MKAVRFYEYGGPGVLRLVEADEPHAGRADGLYANGGIA
jgi:NADPH:quinone reductase-like Zn-dependent oxidoreductase